MSTVDRPRTQPPLLAGQRLDRATFHARYRAMPPRTRAELIGGVVHMPSPLSADHAEENVPVVVWLDHYAEHTPGVRVSINATAMLDESAEPQPDVILRILPEHGGRSRIEDGFIAGAPELIIEIAKSSRRSDLGEKKADYERAGVPEYIVVELGPNRIHWFVLLDGRYEPLLPDPDGLFRSTVFPGLWLDAHALFAGDRPRLRGAVDQGRATPGHAAFATRLAAGGGEAR